jgi:hypothetical protein
MLMVHHVIEPARREIQQWNEIRRIEEIRHEVRDWGTFQKTARFAQFPLPVNTRLETLEYIDMLLAKELVKLRSPAP